MSAQTAFPGFTCFKTYTNGPDIVPGCAGTVINTGEDYCAFVPDNYLNFVTGSPGTGELQRCEADCDSDDNCAGDLVCFFRGADSTNNTIDIEACVPGCCPIDVSIGGIGRVNANYCVDPNDLCNIDTLCPAEED